MSVSNRISPAASLGAAAARGRLVLTLPVIAPAHVIPQLSAPMLSSATQSIAGTFGTRKVGPIALSSQTRGCSVASDGLHCTINVSEPVGKNKLELATFASTDGTGSQLAVSTPLKVNVYAGLKNAATPVWSGRAATFRIAISTRPLQQGVAATVVVTLFAIDAAGAVIPSTSVLDQTGKQVYWSGTAAPPYDTSFQFVNGPLGNLPYSSENFDYDGRTAETVKVKAIGAGQVYARATLRVKPGVASPAQIFSWTGNTIDQTNAAVLLQFGADATGNVAPLRTWQLDAPVVSANADGTFWSGPYTQNGNPTTSWAQEYNASGALLEQVTPLPASVQFVGSGLAADPNNNLYGVQDSVYDGDNYGTPTLTEYSAASSWKKIVRQINLPSVEYGYSALAFDRRGNVFVGLAAGYPGGEILEYGPTQSGSAAPTRTIDLPFGGGTANVAQSISVDSTGNLYTYVRGIAGVFLGQLLEYTPGATTPTYPAYPFGRVNAFALDDQDNAYIEGSLGTTGQYVIEEFAPGSTTAMRTIGGSNTELPVPQQYYQQIGLVIAPTSSNAVRARRAPR
jgi:hypothetical protein